jgi:glucuronate isomerase
MKAAISKRYDVAHELGCRASDHALDYVMYVPATADEIRYLSRIFLRKTCTKLSLINLF